jgi:hypothetical protein
LTASICKKKLRNIQTNNNNNRAVVYVEAENQIIFTINSPQFHNRQESILSYNSALRNSTKNILELNNNSLEKDSNEINKLPSYEECIIKK